MNVEKVFGCALLILGIVLIMLDLAWLETYTQSKGKVMPSISGIGVLFLFMSWFFFWLNEVNQRQVKTNNATEE